MSPFGAAATETNLAATAYFSVHARAVPGVMPRILELFAKRGLVPTAWHSAIGASDRTELTISIEMVGLGRDVTRYIAACLRQITDVDTVRTVESETSDAPRSN
jgi:acetolactate synthase regulatory subunit